MSRTSQVSEKVASVSISNATATSNVHRFRPTKTPRTERAKFGHPSLSPEQRLRQGQLNLSSLLLVWLEGTQQPLMNILKRQRRHRAQNSCASVDSPRIHTRL